MIVRPDLLRQVRPFAFRNTDPLAFPISFFAGTAPVSRPSDASIDPAVSSPSEPASPDASRVADPQWRKYVDSPGLVLLSCFTVFAVFGIPLIFMCRKFSPVMKVFWSAVVILYTLLLFACVGGILYWTYLEVVKAIS